jgi:ribosomal protein S18 acetylase RimI-like enzyme
VIITIRRALVGEAGGVRRCLASAFEPFRYQYTRDAFEDTVPTADAIRERMGKLSVYVAVAGTREIVGTAAYRVEGDEGHMRGMAVHPAWQGHGIADRLLRTVESDLLAAGCARITLDTTEPLHRAISFYRRNGFAASGKVADFFGMPLYEYVKALGEYVKPLAKV